MRAPIVRRGFVRLSSAGVPGDAVAQSRVFAPGHRDACAENCIALLKDALA